MTGVTVFSQGWVFRIHSIDSEGETIATTLRTDDEADAEDWVSAECDCHLATQCICEKISRFLGTECTGGEPHSFSVNRRSERGVVGGGLVGGAWWDSVGFGRIAWDWMGWTGLGLGWGGGGDGIRVVGVG